MNKIATFFRKIQYRLKHGFFTVENVVLMLAIFLCLMWAFKSIESMTKNWELSERLNAEKRSLELLKIETQMAELENEYYNSAEYQELMARKLANKQLAGEHMVYLPENSEEAKNKHREIAKASVEKSYTNFEKWMMYLFPSR
ncbi:hypothetical protein IKW73_01455 [Candidatus Saccharibacteria bacterium]|nr:hypothetical protein [Candidatus Saccharibacteria bacterium]